MTKHQKVWTVNVILFAAILIFAGWRAGLWALAGVLALFGLFKLFEWYDA